MKRKIYDKLRDKEEEATSLGTFVSTLDSSMTMEELGIAEGGDHREDVLKEKRKATASYLSTYYGSQIAGLASNAAASTISDFASDLVKGTISKIFGKRKDKEDDANSLGSFVSVLDSSMTMEDLGIAPGGKYREEIAEEKRKATKSYLSTFYASQTPNPSMISSDERVIGLTRSILSDLYDTDTTGGATSLRSFVANLDSSMTMEDLGLAPGGAYREEAVEEKRKTVAAYISTYYADQLAAVTTASSSVVSDAVNLVKGTLQGLFKGFENTSDTSTLTTLVSQLDSSIDLEELGLNKGGANRAIVTSVQADAVTEYLRAYYSTQIDSLAKEMDSNVAGSSITSTVKNFLGGLFNKKSGSSDPFLESLKKITENLGTSMDVSKFSYDNNAAIRDTIDSGVSEYLTALLSKEKTALIDSIDDRALKAAAREALAEVKIDLKPLASLAIPKATSTSEETVSGEVATTPTYDDSNVLKKLDDMLASLEALLAAFKNDKGNTTIISAGGASYSIDEEFKIQ